MYQRGKIQDESLYYETPEARRDAADHRRQHVPAAARAPATKSTSAELIRSTEEEKQAQIAVVARLPRRARRRPGRRCGACRRSRARGGNVFAELMETVKVASLGGSRARCTPSAASTAATCSARSSTRSAPSIPRRQRRAHRLARAERHRAPLRPRARRPARRPHRLLHPSTRVVRTIPKVGGTKDVNVDRIRELAPDARRRQHRREPRGDGR